MQIGTVKIDGQLVLAPMAGVTDLAFRRICREHGAALTVTEMVSTKALCYQDRKTPRLLELAPDEHPAAAQIFGHEPETMAEGARIALEKSGCDIIDINMGCPAPKIAGNDSGQNVVSSHYESYRLVVIVLHRLALTLSTSSVFLCLFTGEVALLRFLNSLYKRVFGIRRVGLYLRKHGSIAKNGVLRTNEGLDVFHNDYDSGNGCYYVTTGAHLCFMNKVKKNLGGKYG